IDKDQDLDLICAEQDQAHVPNDTFPPQGRVSVFYNNGTGTFTRQDLANQSGHDIALGDIDGDGDIDVLSARHGFWSATPIPIELFLNGLAATDRTPPVISSVVASPAPTA